MTKLTAGEHWKWLRVDPKWQQIIKAEDKHMGWVKAAIDERIVNIKIKVDKEHSGLCGHTCPFLEVHSDVSECHLFSEDLENNFNNISRLKECMKAEGGMY